jgi:repressor of nif and glnA expression
MGCREEVEKIVDISTKRKIMAILKVLQSHGDSMGSAAISRDLANWGIDLRERMVRNYLEMTDRDGLTENLGRRGRLLTQRGRQELDVGIAIDKVGFVAGRVDEMAYRMNFDVENVSGSVIVNTSFIPAAQRSHALREMSTVMNAGLGMGKFLSITASGDTVCGMLVPQGRLAVSTVCSVTLNGVLLANRIIMTSRSGGLLELHEGVPVRFSQIINYDGSTLDPIVTFIKGKMTDVRSAAIKGTGIIGASFREVPTVTIPSVEAIFKRLNAIGLGGTLMIGKPGQPLLDIPVSSGRVGIIVAGGLNPIAVLEEIGIDTTNNALHAVCPFEQLRPIDEIPR